MELAITLILTIAVGIAVLAPYLTVRTILILELRRLHNRKSVPLVDRATRSSAPMTAAAWAGKAVTISDAFLLGGVRRHPPEPPTD
jgi:hypothetical protein